MGPGEGPQSQIPAQGPGKQKLHVQHSIQVLEEHHGARFHPCSWMFQGGRTSSSIIGERERERGRERQRERERERAERDGERESEREREGGRGRERGRRGALVLDLHPSAGRYVPHSLMRHPSPGPNAGRLARTYLGSCRQCPPITPRPSNNDSHVPLEGASEGKANGKAK